MVWLLIIGAAILILILQAELKRGAARHERFERDFMAAFEEIKNIGHQEIAEQLALSMNEALHSEYMEKVNSEFRDKFPMMSQSQATLYWREIQRYLLMASIFKSMDMFSPKVDELWHSMLNHQDEYQQFCKDFAGGEIFHHPKTELVYKPFERTFFDFCYVQLFSIDNSSLSVWGPFFKEGIGQVHFNEFMNEDLSYLIDKYMRKQANLEIVRVFEKFVSKIKNSKMEDAADWQNLYRYNNDASYAYYFFAQTDDCDYQIHCKHIFGDDSPTHSHHSHHEGLSGHHGDTGHGGSHFGSDSSCSSCTSCSSCSSS
ncbi:hypothetical protein ACFVHQ_11250 [Actinomycetes bacterium NPDC127524]